MLFDAVAVVVSAEGCKDLLGEGAAIDFVSHAFVHVKAVGFTPEAQPLLDKAGVEPDEAVIDVSGPKNAFAEHARTRLWEREPKVRVLA